MAAAHLVGAQAQAAMQDAAKNQGGAFTGFMGMNMAQQGGGLNGAVFQRWAQQQQPAAPWFSRARARGRAPAARRPPAILCPEWREEAPKPACGGGWTCTCGAVNTGKFCSECGAKRLRARRSIAATNAAGSPPIPRNLPKFCPECGDPFDENDRA